MIGRNQKYKELTISVDGSSFYGCTFDSCTLVFSGLLPIVLEGNKFKDCKWQFSGPAKATLDFMAAIYAAGSGDVIERTFEVIRGAHGRKRVEPHSKSLN